MAQSAADCVSIKHANALLKAVTHLDELGINLDLSVETVLEINSVAGSPEVLTEVISIKGFPS